MFMIMWPDLAYMHKNWNPFYLNMNATLQHYPDAPLMGL